MVEVFKTSVQTDKKVVLIFVSRTDYLNIGRCETLWLSKIIWLGFKRAVQCSLWTVGDNKKRFFVIIIFIKV